MNCPIDGTPLLMTERHGVEIDYCPKCRGVWLDRGELDKIIERASAASVSARPQAPAPAPAHPTHRVETPRPDRRRWDDDDDYSYGKRRKRKKRDSFLEELFDF